MIIKDVMTKITFFFIAIAFIVIVLDSLMISLPNAGGKPGIVLGFLILSTIIMGILEMKFGSRLGPLIPGLSETKILRGFLYNALIVSLVSGFAIYVSKYLERASDKDLRGLGPILGFQFQGGKSGARMELISIIATSFVFSMFFYLLFHIIFGFGDSMISSR